MPILTETPNVRHSKPIEKSQSSVGTLIVGVLVFLSIPDQIALFESERQSSANARTVPYLITSLIILISLLMTISESVTMQIQAADAPDVEPQERVSYGRVCLTFIAIALWIVILPYLGFNISTILLVASVMLIIGNCRWW